MLYNNFMDNKKLIKLLLLLSILIIGLSLRIMGLGWGIPCNGQPYPFHPDELIQIRSLSSFSFHSLNPHYFVNPPLFTYILGIYFLFLKLIGVIKIISINQSASSLGLLLLSGRFITVLFGMGTVILVYFLAFRWFNKFTGLLAAGFLAFLPLHVVHSHYLTVEVVGTFFIVLSFFLLSGLDKEVSKGVWYVVLCGLVIGFAAATKYTGFLVYFPGILTVAKYRCSTNKKFKFLDSQVFYFSASVFLGFILANPYSLLAFPEFTKDIFKMFLINIQSPASSYPLSMLFMFCFGIPFLILSLYGIIVSIKLHSWGDIMMVIWIGMTSVLLIISRTPFTRHVVLLAPFLAIISARAIDKTYFFFRNHNFIKKYIVTMVIGVIFIWTFLISFAYSSLMMHKDIRVKAADWIDNNIAKESTIGIGKGWFYTPPLNWRKYKVVQLNYHPELLISTNPKYLIFSDFEYRKNSYIRRFFGGKLSSSSRFFNLIFKSKHYKIIKLFERHPFFPFRKSGKGYPPHDWMYPYPTIIVIKQIN